MSKKTVFTNGCFDVLHKGHLALLEFCRNEGDLIIVGINSDESIKKLKGLERPINKLEDRIYALECLRFVDKVISFSEETPQKLINELKPSIIVKGGDYSADKVHSYPGAVIKIFPYIEGYSSSKIISQINPNGETNSVELESSQNSKYFYVKKGWGFEKWIINNEKYCGKFLFFKQGKKFSWHYHNLKDETFYIDKGEVELLFSEIDDLNRANSIILKKGDSFHVAVGIRHQIRAILDSVVIEFSTTHFDDDSIRVIRGD